MSTPSLALKDSSEDARREAARLMGSIKTEKKAEAARRNGFKPGQAPVGRNQGRKHKALSEFVCSCTAGDAMEGHKWDCLRGQAIKRRIAEGRDLQTGEKLAQVSA